MQDSSGPDRVGTFSLSVDPTPWIVVSGALQLATKHITISRSGFPDPIELTATAQQGLVLKLIQPSTDPTEAFILAKADASATLGDHPVTITGTARGVTQQVVAHALVYADASGLLLGVELVPEPKRPVPGGDVMYAVSLSRYGYSEAVELALDGLPAGWTAALPGPITGDSASFSIRLPDSPTLGYHGISLVAIVKGSIPSIAVTTPFALYVPAPDELCGDPAGCQPVVSSTGSLYASLYTGTSCDGDEYGGAYHDWDGRGLMGNTAYGPVAFGSQRRPSGRCVSSSFSSTSVHRIFREAPLPSCSSCGLCTTCVNGACVPTGDGDQCGAQTVVCLDKNTSSATGWCHQGSCSPILADCTNLNGCNPATGTCNGNGS